MLKPGDEFHYIFVSCIGKTFFKITACVRNDNGTIVYSLTRSSHMNRRTFKIGFIEMTPLLLLL